MRILRRILKEKEGWIRGILLENVRKIVIIEKLNKIVLIIIKR